MGWSTVNLIDYLLKAFRIPSIARRNLSSGRRITIVSVSNLNAQEIEYAPSEVLFEVDA